MAISAAKALVVVSRGVEMGFDEVSRGNVSTPFTLMLSTAVAPLPPTVIVAL